MAGFKTHPIKLTFASLAAGMLFVSCGKKHEASSALKQNVTNAVSNPQISKPAFSDLFRKVENLSGLSEGDRSDINGFLHIQKQWGNKEFTPLEIPEAVSLPDGDIEAVAKLLAEQPAVEMCEFISSKTATEKGAVFTIVQLQCLTTKSVYYFGKPSAGSWRYLGATESEVPPKRWTRGGEPEKGKPSCPRKSNRTERSRTLSSRNKPCSW